MLDYLIKNGSKQVVVDARAHLPNIQTLTTYQHIDSSDTDVGQSGRLAIFSLASIPLAVQFGYLTSYLGQYGKGHEQL